MAQRILRGATATLHFYLLDADGSPVAAAGALTVGITRADGTILIASGTATTTVATGHYTYTLAAASTVTLDLLTATWTDSVTPTAAQTTTHEIVGGYVFSVAQAQAFESLGDLSAYQPADIIAKRAEVEDELEQIRNAAFVPRYARLTLDGTGDSEIITGLTWLRTLRSVRVYAQVGSSSYTAFTAAQVAACIVTEDGRVRRGDGNVFQFGVGNIMVEVEHGFTDWGEDLRNAALHRLRSMLNRAGSAVPDRAKAFTSADGYSYDLTAPSETSTGIPDVDMVYARYPRLAKGVQPSSRTLNYDPQYGALFHGGIS